MTERLREFLDVLQTELSGLRVPAGSVKEFAVKRQHDRARKRARLNTEGLAASAVSQFVKTNEEVGRLTISLDPKLVVEAQLFIRNMLERYTSSLVEDSIQCPLDLSVIFDNWRFGPGASYEVKGTHACEKITQPFTCTSSCEPLVEKLRSGNPYFALYDSEMNVGTRVVRGSRLTTVPKNEDTERTIAIEPLGNMCLQLAAGRYLEGALRYIGLDISTQQPKNKAAACRGSIDDSLATIDMKSASDMISIDLVSRLMPREWCWFLLTVRSPEIRINNEWLKLNMISTMGNGFTFPLMTLIISSLIYAYRRLRGGPVNYINWRDTCVFGDDVIVPKEEFHGVCEVLEQAGFLINHEKSYGEGPFKESCGGDYFHGEDVTPFYVKDLDHNASVYVVINQVVAWSEKTGVFLHQTLIFLKGLLDGKAYFVPEWSQPTAGIRTIQVSRKYKYLKPRKIVVRRREDVFTTMLAIGGYLYTDFGTATLYAPRPRGRVAYKTAISRLPRGYLDGWDPGLGSHRAADARATVIALVFA